MNRSVVTSAVRVNVSGKINGMNVSMSCETVIVNLSVAGHVITTVDFTICGESTPPTTRSLILEVSVGWVEA